MKKILLILLGTLMVFSASAVDFEYFYKGEKLTYTIIDEDAKTCKIKDGDESSAGNSVSGDLIIPSVVVYYEDEYSVTEIGVFAFASCDLTQVTIPNSVTTIGDCAFNNCAPLTSVTIPESVTSIGNSAFEFCCLTSLTLPESVTSIGKYAFSGCNNLRMLDLTQSKMSDFANFIGENYIPENALIFVPEGTKGIEGRANVIVGDQCENLVINYGMPDNQQQLNVPYAFTAKKVTINRSFTEGQPYTLYLPFKMNASKYGTFYTGGELNEDGSMVYFTKVTEENTTPNTPYMFQPNQDFTDGITIEGDVDVTMTPEDTEADGLNGVYKMKIFSPDENAQKRYYGWAGGKFCLAGRLSRVDACRAYYKLPASAAAKAPARLNVKLGEDGTTGITAIDREDGTTDSPAYNINGQRVTDGYRGVVIKNGRKTANFAR